MRKEYMSAQYQNALTSQADEFLSLRRKWQVEGRMYFPDYERMMSHVDEMKINGMFRDVVRRNAGLEAAREAIVVPPRGIRRKIA